MAQDWLAKKASEELETMAKRQEQAKAGIPAAYHEFIVLLRQNKQIGNLRNGESLSQEARRLGAWDKDGKVFIPLDTPYFTVDGRVAWARSEHRKEGKKLNIDTYPDLQAKLFYAVVESEIYGKAKGHSMINIGGGGVDRTNPMENAESSAIGRALGFLGYGLIGTGIASAEEVQASIVEQKRLEQEQVKNHLSVVPPTSSPSAPPVENQPKNDPAPSNQKAEQKQDTSQVGAAKFSGEVVIQNIQFEEAPKGNGLMATVECTDEDGQQRQFIAGPPLADRIDEWALDKGTHAWVFAQHVPTKDRWLILDLKLASQQNA